MKKTMSDSRKKLARRKIKQHEDLLTDPQYRQKVDKHFKVRKREQEDKEAREAIRDYTEV